jgi:hypothetical protein
MEEAEIMQRVVGALTRMQEWVRDPAAAEADQSGIVSELLMECLSPLRFDRSWSDERLSAELSKQISGSLLQVIASFASAFLQLAEYHDAGDTDVSSADVLRELAVRAEAEPSGA